MHRFFYIIVLLFAVTLLHAEDNSNALWYSQSDGEQIQLELYFFWSQHCPHCQQARPFIENLQNDYAWINTHSLSLDNNRDNVSSYQKMASLFKREPGSVPAFFFCDTMLTGFESEESTGRFILEQLSRCRERLLTGEQSEDNPTDRETLSQLAGFDISQLSLPVLTLAIAALDAFNPCAFFVLFFLLSLLVHARNRRRVLFIGTVFVSFSALIYFFFMAAWLNLFLLMGPLQWVTLLAGLIAIIFALINIKDYFISGTGPSLSIPEQAKPGLFRKMRLLLQVDNTAALLLGTVVLAITANSYELLCTSGLPMIYTRILTMEQLPTSSYYLYLAAYNVIYVTPLAVIVLLYAATLGSRKLTAEEGKILKLMSGLLMLGLGLVLVFAPALLGNIPVILGIVVSAIVITALFTVTDCSRRV